MHSSAVVQKRSSPSSHGLGTVCRIKYLCRVRRFLQKSSSTFSRQSASTRSLPSTFIQTTSSGFSKSPLFIYQQSHCLPDTLQKNMEKMFLSCALILEGQSGAGDL